MGYKYINDFSPVDFRISRSPRLRRVGFELVQYELQLKQIEKLWFTKNFQPSRRKFGYICVVLFSAVSGLLLLTYMLQFQLAADRSEAEARWFEAWWKGSLSDLAFSPLILLVQFSMIILLWRQMMPVDDTLLSQHAMDKAAFALYHLFTASQKETNHQVGTLEGAAGAGVVEMTGDIFTDTETVNVHIDVETHEATETKAMVKAMKSYSTARPGYMNFTKGDVIQVVSSHGNWHTGILRKSTKPDQNPITGDVLK